MRKVLDYIENNLHENLSLQKIAKERYYSPFHFYKIFKVIIGETIQDFVVRKRLEKSALILSKNKNKPLHEIYTALGFNRYRVLVYRM